MKELIILTLKRQTAVFCLLSVIPQEFHMLPGQMDFLKYRKKILEPISERLYMIPLKTGLPK